MKEIEDIKALVVDENFPLEGGASSDETVTMLRSCLTARKIVREQLATCRDEDDRRANVMIFNSPEAKSDSKDYANDEDIQNFLDITKVCEVPFTSKDVMKVTRLGKKPISNDNGEITRPILIKLKSEQKKKQLFKRLHLWREFQEKEAKEGEKISFIVVTHDMSQEQRKERSLMWEEVKKKQFEIPAESPFRFVIRGPPWKMVIRKVKRDDKK